MTVRHAGRAISSAACLAIMAGLVAETNARGDAPASVATLPETARSVRIERADEPIRSAPSGSAKRRGSGIVGALLPVYAARRGDGCTGQFLQVGADAWVCDDQVALSGLPALEAGSRRGGTLDGLPFRYFFVGPDGTAGYKRIDDVDIAPPDMQLDPGFAVAIVEERLVDGERFGLSNGGLWIPMRDVGASAPSTFHGSDVGADSTRIPFAWVVSEVASVHRRQAGVFVATGEARSHFDKVAFLEEATRGTTSFVRIDENAWVDARDLRHPTLSSAPAEVDVASGEHWIDVDLASQTLVAYEGARAMFATLVSTGKGVGSAPNATPRGVFRVWVKLLSTNMDNLEDDNAARYYRMEDVPWVQYFSKGVGLHGVYWHRSFGRVRSHGCVNLAPLDAERLFWWTGPKLPAGWSATLPYSHEVGAIVRVR